MVLRLNNQSSPGVHLARTLVLVICSLAITDVVGQSEGKFVPTETEWAVWPQLCRARYIDIPLGRSTQYANRLSSQEISAVEAMYSVQTFESIHHYCFALGYFMRAREQASNLNSPDYSFLLRQVIEESQYTIERMDLREPVAVDVAYLKARAHALMDQFEIGEKVLETVIQAQPTMPSGYVALSLLYRANDFDRKAIETLDLAMERVAVPSSELYYSKGLAHFDSGEFDVARSFALKAYEMGYPLPGLKRKLMARGQWEPDSEPN